LGIDGSDPAGCNIVGGKIVGLGGWWKCGIEPDDSATAAHAHTDGAGYADPTPTDADAYLASKHRQPR
jgi:hypothetical protein